MKRSHFLALILLASISPFGSSPSAAAEKTPACFELRIYHAAEGKLDALNTRFKDHTTALFTRHGMTNVGYWMPLDNAQQLLIYLLSYPDLAAREASWKAFQADPEWKAAKAASEVTGTLVKKVDSRFLTFTDFSPEMKVVLGGAPYTFEMRTYTTTPGNLPRLLNRFRQHTVALFTKHGMRHYGYFTPSPGQPGADDTLIYFLYHTSSEVRKASFSSFVADPEWNKVKALSETAAGGSLTIPDGVKSELLVATDYSPVK